jgi:hypothetical protein
VAKEEEMANKAAVLIAIATITMEVVAVNQVVHKEFGVN